MDKPDINALAQNMISAVKSFVANSERVIGKRLDELDAKLSGIPAGPKGERGEPGKDIDQLEVTSAIQAAVALHVAALPAAKQGEPGKDAEVDTGLLSEMVNTSVRAAVTALPAPQDGRPGAKGEPGSAGKDVDEDAIFGRLKLKLETFCNLSVASAVESIPKPENGKDGASIHPDTVALMVRDAVEKAVAALPVAKDGAPGRDAAELTPLPAIDETRSYAAGTYAKHNGGEIRAERRTDPVKDGDLLAAGWTVAREGIAGVAITQGDDPRDIEVGAMLTSGVKVVASFSIPMIIDKGVWREGLHEKGDHVTWDGSGWIAQRQTTLKPGDKNDDWRLSTKRGRDGKDAEGVRAAERRDVVRLK